MAKKGTKRKSKRQSGGVRKKGKTGETRENPTPPPVEVEHGITISTSHSNDGSENEDISSTSKDTTPMQPLEFFFDSSQYTKTCKIQTRCLVYKTVQLFKKKQFATELAWFKRHPQFQHVFHMGEEKNRKLQGLWMLLLRTVVTEGNRIRWFVVNGVPIRYSLREHALISGLDCHDYPRKYKKLGSNKFRDRHFKKVKVVTIGKVREKLLSMPECGERLQMAVLYFLGTVLRGTSKVKGPIDPFILRMVDDLDVCETFPWGRLTFEHAVKTIDKVKDLMKGTAKKTFTFPGFIIPLEVLAFECIPSLSQKFREPVEGHQDACPRMCKEIFASRGMKGFPLEDIYEALGRTKVIQSILVPSLDEEPMMARIITEDPDDEDDEGPSGIWNEYLSIQQKKIWWSELYELDVGARVFPSKKEVVEEAEEEAEAEQSGFDQSGFETRMKKIFEDFDVKLNKSLGEYEKKMEEMSETQRIMKKKIEKMSKTQRVLKKKCSALEKRVREEEERHLGDREVDNMDWGGRRDYEDGFERQAGEGFEREDEELFESQENEEKDEEEKGDDEEKEVEKEVEEKVDDKEKEVENEVEKDAVGSEAEEKSDEEIEKAVEEKTEEEKAVEKGGEEEKDDGEAVEEVVEKADDDGEAVEEEKEVVEKADDDGEAVEEKEKEEVEKGGEEKEKEAVEKGGEEKEREEEKIYDPRMWALIPFVNPQPIRSLFFSVGEEEAAAVIIELQKETAPIILKASPSKKRGRPRKEQTEEQDFHPKAKRKTAPSQWKQSPYTEGKSEEPKKKGRGRPKKLDR